MSDEDRDQGTEGKESHEHDREFLSELSRFGRKVGSAVQQTWERDERKAVQEKVMTELKSATDHVEKLAKKVGQTPAAHELQEGAEKFGRKMGEGLLQGLQALNKELSRALEKDESKRDEETEGEETDK